ncbi:hypothetical protein K438DRAFT_2022165 [Mycena galopus ATCC 62051]|nr:hypothetical protein K438DRAFT_2022165 [Mycena galopus ATCC 62051]
MRSAQSCSPLRRRFITSDRVDRDSEMTESGPAGGRAASRRIHDASVVPVSACGRLPLHASTNTACSTVPLPVPLTHPHHGHFLLPSVDRTRALSSVHRDSRPRRYNREYGAAPASMRAEYSASVSARGPPPPLDPCLSRRSLPTPLLPTSKHKNRKGKKDVGGSTRTDQRIPS